MKTFILFAILYIATFKLAFAKQYCGTWTAAQYIRGSSPINIPNVSIRQTLRTSIEGKKLRFHFSNIYSNSKLELVEVHVAKSLGHGTGKIDTSTDTVITFNGGSKNVTIPAEEDIISDTIDFDAPALSDLAITIYYGENVPQIDEITGHPQSRTTSFFEHGNSVSKETFSSSIKSEQWFTISGIDVLTDNPDNKAIVCLGDSITDGKNSDDNKQNRWPDILAKRLQNNEETNHIAVLNQGIGATGVAGNFKNPGYPSGQYRIQKDVINQAGVKYLIMLYGINDILYSSNGSKEIIKAYKYVIDMARNAGIKVYGGTILPFGRTYDCTVENEKKRNEVNEWIRNTSSSEGGFDSVIDFAKLMMDTSNSTWLRQEWSSDGLHPNSIGYEVMGNAINLDLFKESSKAVTVTTTVTTTEIDYITTTTTQVSTTTTTEVSTALMFKTKTITEISTTTVQEKCTSEPGSGKTGNNINDADYNNDEKDSSWIIKPRHIIDILFIALITGLIVF